MAVERKAKKDKEIVLELENQIKDIRQLLAEQLRCLDQHLDCHVGMLQDLQEYYRRHAEAELEFSKVLDKLAKQLSVRQKRDPLATGYSTHTTWQMLMDSTRQQSKNHGFLGDIFSPLVVNKLSEVLDDIQRIHRRCREMMTGHHEELFKVLTELENAMKTYQTYHGNSQQAETKLLRVQSQRVKVDQQNALSKRFINYDKKAEQKQAKYAENKLKALKARNEYLLSIDSANAAIRKYFKEDFPKLVEKMDFGYHASLTQVVGIHIGASNCLMNNDQERMNMFLNQSRNIVASHDNAYFRTQYHKLFVKPDDFLFQPHKGDEICQISAQKAVQDEMVSRIASIKERIDSNVKENQERLRNIERIEQELMNKITHPDVDVVQLYREEKTGLKSPTDKEKRREERLKSEEIYLQMCHEYMKADSLTARLNSKYVSLHKAVGEGNYDTILLGASSESTRRRPPSLPPKPKKLIKKTNGNQPRLFGGAIEEYVEATGTQIPIVVRSCIRIINLYGMHHTGIFRVSGSQNDINQYKQQFEKGIDPLTSKVEGDDINSIAGLLKLYFRELKEPLFPQEKFPELISNAERFTDNQEACISELRAMITSLPRPRMIVMRYLFAFLNHLSEFSDENMMDAYNLAICFGPTLLPTPVSSDFCNHVYVNRVIENLILHQDEVFPTDDDAVYEKCIVECEKDFLDSMSDDDLLNSNIPDEDDDIEDHEGVAAYDYEGRTDSELSFKKGDVLMLFNQVSSDWWNGEFRGQKGLIPDKYIQPTKKSRERSMTNLKKGCAQAKSSECLLSPGDTSVSSSSSLDRCISQPNVAVPVPSLPQLGIPASDQLPNVAHSSQIRDDKDSSEDGLDVTLSLDSALAKVSSGLQYIEKLEHNKVVEAPASAKVSDLDVLIPVQTPSPLPASAKDLHDTSQSQPKVVLSSFGGVRKSTSFRTANETSSEKEHQKQRHMTIDNVNKNFISESLSDTLPGSTLSLAAKPADVFSADRKTSKSSTLPPNLQPPNFGAQGTSGFDSDLLEEINSFSTFPRSSPGETHKKVVPPVKPRPPIKKSTDNGRHSSSSGALPAPDKSSVTAASSETAGKK